MPEAKTSMKLFLSIGILFWAAIAALAYRAGAQTLAATIAIGAPIGLFLLVGLLRGAGKEAP